MKKSLLIGAFAMTLLVRWACAQAPASTASTKDVLPPGPLVVTKMPDLAQWTVDSTYSNTPKPGEPSVLDKLKQAALNDPSLAKALQDPQYVFTVQNIRPVHILVTQTGEITHEERTFEQNLKGEMWSNSQIKVEKRPNLSLLVAVINIDFGNNVFPDFDWISKENFIGIQTHSNIKCMAFKQDRYNDQHQFIGTAYAYVDIATHYPVGYQFLSETREYAFLPPPSGQLSIPDDFLAAAKAMMDHLQKATPHLATP